MKRTAASLTVLTLIGRHRAAASSFVHSSLRRDSCCHGVRPFQQTRHFSPPSHTNRSQKIGLSERTVVMEDNTRYYITTKKRSDGTQKPWIRIAFDPQHDTSITHYHCAISNKRIAKQQQQQASATSSATQSQSVAPKGEANNRSKGEVDEVELPPPESVLQYQRQLRKIQAADRASKTNVNIHDHLHSIYSDEHIVVTNKPSGILCVPGVNNNKSLLDLVFEVYGGSGDSDDAASYVIHGEAVIETTTVIGKSVTKIEDDDRHDKPSQSTKSLKKRKNSSKTSLTPSHSETSSDMMTTLSRDNMIVHRLDMDTSGIVVFARTRHAMSNLHEAFRQNKEMGSTRKVYEALLVGWLDINCWMDAAVTMEDENDIVDDAGGSAANNGENVGGGEINLPLQRDHKHPPFMRVSTPHSEAEARQAVSDLNNAGYQKLIAKRPKSSVTRFRILKYEFWMGHEVTRVELYPVTGRTHQLRVHCAVSIV